MDIIIYHILTIGILFFFYEVFLKDSKFFNLNRIYLILTPIIPFGLIWLANNSSFSSEIATINPIQLKEIVVEDLGGVETSIFTSYGLFYAYLVISLVLFFSVGYRYYKTWNSIRKYNFEESTESNIKVAYVKDSENYSFFNKIILNPDQKNDPYILPHETKHVTSGHSFDILLYKFYKSLFWFNPFLYLLERRLKLTHEYEADDYACSNQEYEYANCLLNQVFGTSSIQFINQFNNQNSIKMRIKMLKQKQVKQSGIKYLGLIPLFGLMLILGSWESPSNPINVIVNGGEDPVYEKVDKMPEFKGGMDAMISYMSKETNYPETAKKNGVMGKVFVEFTVTKKGVIKNVKIKKGSDNRELDLEALRVVSSMPDWNPGEKEGKKVNVKMVLPIVFKI
jgi:TonB family protein